MRPVALAAALALLAVPALANPCGNGADKGMKVVNYATGVAALSREDKAMLADWAKTAKHRVVCIFAQVDKQGSKAANEKVARDRAETARDFLVSQGVPRNNIAIALQDEAITFFGLLPTDQDDDRRITLMHD